MLALSPSGRPAGIDHGRLHGREGAPLAPEARRPRGRGERPPPDPHRSGSLPAPRRAWAPSGRGRAPDFGPRRPREGLQDGDLALRSPAPRPRRKGRAPVPKAPRGAPRVQSRGRHPPRGGPLATPPEGGAKDARGPALLEEDGPGGHRASAATSSASVFSGVGVRGPRGAQGACADTRSHAVAASKPRPALSSELAPFSFGSHLGALASILGCSPLDDGACPPPSHCWVDPVVFEVCQAPRHRGTKRRLYPHG